MKKKIIKVVALVLSLALCFALGTSASSLLQKIEAYLNYGITVKLNGEEQRMYDANGTRVYPISYQGTTYVPIRAVSNMLGIDVNWDGPNNTVLLGKTGEWMDFIETVQPYAASNYTVKHYRISDNRTVNVGGKIYNNYIKLDSDGSKMYYNLEGKYDEFTFKAFHDSRDCTVKIYGDNEELIKTIQVKEDALPSDTHIDVRGVQQLTIELITNVWDIDGYLYVVDAKIK